jgi:hypothetical protein
MIDRRNEIRMREDYLGVRAHWTALLKDLDELPPQVKARLAHDLLLEVESELSYHRGQALFALVYDHSYDEIGSLVGLTRQRVHQLVGDHMERHSVDPWPAVGRQSRIAARRLNG